MTDSGNPSPYSRNNDLGGREYTDAEMLIIHSLTMALRDRDPSRGEAPRRNVRPRDYMRLFTKAGTFVYELAKRIETYAKAEQLPMIFQEKNVLDWIAIITSIRLDQGDPEDRPSAAVLQGMAVNTRELLERDIPESDLAPWVRYKNLIGAHPKKADLRAAAEKEGLLEHYYGTFPEERPMAPALPTQSREPLRVPSPGSPEIILEMDDVVIAGARTEQKPTIDHVDPERAKAILLHLAATFPGLLDGETPVDETVVVDTLAVLLSPIEKT